MTRDGDTRTIRIRCGTWDQVEAFYAEKVLASRGNILVVKMPFRPGIGESMTVALGLPDGLVLAVDGTVMKIGGDDAGRVPVALRLHGLSTDVRAQLKRLVAQGRGQAVTPIAGTRAVGTKPPGQRAPLRALIETLPPSSEPTLREVIDDERGVFDELVATRERLSLLPAHELLGVVEGATEEQARVAYLTLALKLHPDKFRRYRSAALRVLAADIFVLARRAYDRLAGTEVDADKDGWLYAMPEPGEALSPLPISVESSGVPQEPLEVSGSAPYSEMSVVRAQTSSSAGFEDDVSFTTSVRMRALTAEELFDDEAQAGEAQAPVAAKPGEEKKERDSGPVRAAATSGSEKAIDGAALSEAGRAALNDGRFREACEAFASLLRQDPRNRTIRALYHVASGLDLRAKGDGVKARLQFETALAHDKDCEEARRALTFGPDRKSGIFKRLFDK